MKRLTLIGIVCVVSIMLTTTWVLWIGAGVRPAIALSAGNTYHVNSTADTPDVDVGDGVCADIDGHCSLRAAIMQANYLTGPDTITLTAGVYLLTRSGDDDAAVLGDLDIVDNLAIQGAGSGATIVDGNGTKTGDRVFQILASSKETSLSGLTIRNGKKVANTFDEGGGLYWDGGGGHLHLNDVIIDGNTARYAGGLYLNYSSLGDTVEMDHVIVHANTATTGAAGGLGVNFGDFASFELKASQVYSNTAYEGGGVYFQSAIIQFGIQSVRIETTQIYSNTASLSAGFENHSGDTAIPVILENSHVYKNRAGYYGGGIGNYGVMSIISTTLEKNNANVRGGGLYDYEGGHVNIVQSTLSENYAQFGGGIYSELFIHNNAALSVINSTISGNTASRDGGGLYAVGGNTQILNATIANNHIIVPIGTFYTGLGGGIYITATAVVFALNTLIADNTRRYHIDTPVADDCYASVVSLNSLGYNLVETTTNCLINGTISGNIIGQDPMLGPLQNNGGTTYTQSPLPGSPAIDNGNACPPTDQRGHQRPVGPQCDIGAVEYYVLPHVYLPMMIK